MLFSPCSLYSRCLFFHLSTPILIFLPSLFNVSPNVAYNACPNKLFAQLYFFSMPLSVHDFFSLFSSSITLVYKFIAKDFYCFIFHSLNLIKLLKSGVASPQCYKGANDDVRVRDVDFALI